MHKRTLMLRLSTIVNFSYAVLCYVCEALKCSASNAIIHSSPAFSSTQVNIRHVSVAINVFICHSLAKCLMGIWRVGIAAFHFLTLTSLNFTSPHCTKPNTGLMAKTVVTVASTNKNWERNIWEKWPESKSVEAKNCATNSQPKW